MPLVTIGTTVIPLPLAVIQSTEAVWAQVLGCVLLVPAAGLVLVAWRYWYEWPRGRIRAALLAGLTYLTVLTVAIIGNAGGAALDRTGSPSRSTSPNTPSVSATWPPIGQPLVRTMKVETNTPYPPATELINHRGMQLYGEIAAIDTDTIALTVSLEDDQSRNVCSAELDIGQRLVTRPRHENIWYEIILLQWDIATGEAKIQLRYGLGKRPLEICF